MVHDQTPSHVGTCACGSMHRLRTRSYAMFNETARAKRPCFWCRRYRNGHVARPPNYQSTGLDAPLQGTGNTQGESIYMNSYIECFSFMCALSRSWAHCSSLSEQLPFEASSSVGDCSARCCQRASWFASLHGCRGEAARCNMYKHSNCKAQTLAPCLAKAACHRRAIESCDPELRNASRPALLVA